MVCVLCTFAGRRLRIIFELFWSRFIPFLDVHDKYKNIRKLFHSSRYDDLFSINSQFTSLTKLELASLVGLFEWILLCARAYSHNEIISKPKPCATAQQK